VPKSCSKRSQYCRSSIGSETTLRGLAQPNGESPPREVAVREMTPDRDEFESLNFSGASDCSDTSSLIDEEQITRLQLKEVQKKL